MRSRRQPKVHKYAKRRSRRISSPGRTVLSICFTFVIAGAIGVVGYSIAKPILQFTGTESTSQDASDLVEELAAPAETAVQTTVIVTQSATETTQMQSETVALAETLVGVRLSESALADAQTLSDAIAAARESVPDGTILVIPLKVQGGAVFYQTSVDLAAQCGAAQGTLTLSEITAAAQVEGWMPIAECSLLYDNLLPDADAQAGYMVEDEGSRWLDNKKESGGKPWASPFSDVMVAYCTALIQEIAAGGFEQIWCTDVMFPPFRDTDLSYIGASVQDANRGEVLVQLMNTLADAAGTTPVLLETDAESVLDGTDEALDSSALEISGVAFDLGTQVQAQTMLDWMVEQTEVLQIWFLADDGTVSTEMEQTQSDAGEVSGWIAYDAE